MTAHEIASRIRRTQLPEKPAWLLAFEYQHAIDFDQYTDYRPGVSYGVWGASISAAQAQQIAEAYGVELGPDGAALEHKRFSIVRAAGWMVCAYQGDE